MKKILPILIALAMGGFSAVSQAENLMQVYKQARATNPDLQAAAATRDAAFEKINEARSPLLPQLGLGLDYDYANGYHDANGINSKVASGSLQLTQTVFDMSKWRSLTLQEKTAGIADVTYQTAQQTLILNTATDYFNVLSAIDTLSYIEAEKQAVYHELDQTTQRFGLGLVAITDVQNARSTYDSVLASEVNARNSLENYVEVLRQVSGVYYPQLSSVNVKTFTTQSPEPVQKLLREGENRNLSLLSARLSQDLAREEIRYYEAGHMPTLDLTASTGLTNTKYNGNRTGPVYGYDNSIDGDSKVGLSLTIPLYSGGEVTSQVKQAQLSFVNYSAQLESAHRSMVQTVRSSFNNIAASISSINAYQQAVVSAQSSLDASQAGYKVGTRTIVDVLDATTTLYEAKQELSTARYTYLINQLNVKSALGTLNENDLLSLNGFLTVPVPTDSEQVAPETPQENAQADGYDNNVYPATATPTAPVIRASDRIAPAAPKKSGNPFQN